MRLKPMSKCVPESYSPRPHRQFSTLYSTSPKHEDITNKLVKVPKHTRRAQSQDLTRVNRWSSGIRGSQSPYTTSHPLFPPPSLFYVIWRTSQAAKAYENHCRENGKPESHAEAKEILAGFAGAFIDREFETRGLGFMDREKAKHHARKTLDENVLSNEY